MEELPEEFWLSIRHVCSFKNINDYTVYLKKEIEKWEDLKNNSRQSA